MMRIAHVSPTYYSPTSVIGGGERYVIYFSKALAVAAAEKRVAIRNSLIALGPQTLSLDLSDEIDLKVFEGKPWEIGDLSADFMRSILDGYDAVFVHQCLCTFGLFIASQAKLMGMLVVGLDHGGGEDRMVNHSPEIGSIFDFFVAYSSFGSNFFRDLDGRVEVIRGPVDDSAYTPGEGDKDHKNVVAVGRLLPHKGFERIINTLPGELCLTIFGSSYDAAYNDYLVECSNGKNVKIERSASDGQILQALRQAGLFVHASTHLDHRGTYYAKPELLGLAPLEALACGTPTLVSSAGSLPELTAIDGCLSFRDDHELAELLRLHCEKKIKWPLPIKIHDETRRLFGLRQFGEALIALLV